MHKTCRPYALIFAVAAFLSACVQTLAPFAPEFSITPDVNGLAVTPSGLRIDFGRAPEGVITLLDGSFGSHIVLGIAACPTGIVQNLRWNDLVLTFSDERFVGWQKNGVGQGRICAD